MATDSVAVEHLFTLELLTAPQQNFNIVGGPAGRRIIGPVMGGTFKGGRLNGTVAPLAGADWVTVRPDKSLRLDVRLVLQTDDGATIFMHYGGIAVNGIARSAPYFETGDERYTWLNNVQAVGIGALDGSVMRYEVSALL
jgi:hypothetical protein